MSNKYGYTEDCEGCRFKQAGLDNSRAHSEVCRRRLVEALKADNEDVKAIDRENERIALRVAEGDKEDGKEKEDVDEEMGIDSSEVKDWN